VPSAPYFLMLVFALTGFVLSADKWKNFSLPLSIFVLAALLTYELSPSHNDSLFMYLLMVNFVLLFSAGAAQIVRGARESGISRVKKMWPAAAAAVAVSVLFALHGAPLKLFTPRVSRSQIYSSEFLRATKRDALLFINTEDDPMFTVTAGAVLNGLRQDVTPIYPDEFDNIAYRDMLRKRFGSSLILPTEKQYNDLKDQAAKLTKLPEGAPQNTVLLKKRILYNLMMLSQSAIARQNALHRPVYFNTIRHFLRNKRFNWMCFNPDKFLFSLCENTFADCAKDRMLSNPKFAGKLDAKKNELMSNREFQKAMKNRHIGGGQLKDEMLGMILARMSDAAMSCDSGKDGFSTKCAIESLKLLFGARNKDDLYPFPLITRDCFENQFFWNPNFINAQMAAIERTSALDDPDAARLVSSFYTDLGEHSYIHNDNRTVVYDNNAEKFTTWMFEAAALTSVENTRAHLFLLLEDEKAAKYQEANDETETLMAQLKNRERVGKLDDYYIYMLAELYRKMGRSADVEKYLKFVQGGSGPNLAPLK
jgi:hypothetical protein